jgi:hypothetical protein
MLNLYTRPPPFEGELSQSQIGAPIFATRLLMEGRSTKFVVDYVSHHWAFDPRDAAEIVEWAQAQIDDGVWERRAGRKTATRTVVLEVA